MDRAESDTLGTRELPESVRQDMTQWACCIGGAIDEKAYLQKIHGAGFNKPQIVENKVDKGKKNCCGNTSIIASVAVKAFKPK